jgi:uncharacterized protein (TIGR03083 family)
VQVEWERDGMADIWAIVPPERQSLADDLDAMDDAAWATPSLCPEWTVRDVLAHMTALARMTPPKFFGKLVTSGFNPGRLQARDITLERGTSPAETLERFRGICARNNRLPGQKKTLAGETVVHAEDIRRPLRIAHHYPVEALITIADHYKDSDLVAGTRTRIEGLSLRATDIEWSTGSGPSVSGPMLSLLMVMAGRRAPVADLEGDGVQTLRSRL